MHCYSRRCGAVRNLFTFRSKGYGLALFFAGCFNGKQADEQQHDTNRKGDPWILCEPCNDVGDKGYSCN